MPVTTPVYRIKDLPQITQEAQLIDKILEIESGTADENFRVSIPTLVQTVANNLPGANNAKQGYKMVRCYDSATVNYRPGDETLVELDPAFLCLGCICKAEFPGKEYVLVYSANGPLTVWLDGLFANETIDAKWVEKDSLEDQTKGILDFNPFEADYQEGDTVKYVLDTFLRLFVARMGMEKNAFGNLQIPAPTGLPSDPYWREVNPAGLTKIKDWLDGSYKKHEVVVYRGQLLRAKRDIAAPLISIISEVPTAPSENDWEFLAGSGGSGVVYDDTVLKSRLTIVESGIQQLNTDLSLLDSALNGRIDDIVTAALDWVPGSYVKGQLVASNGQVLIARQNIQNSQVAPTVTNAFWFKVSGGGSDQLTADQLAGIQAAQGLSAGNRVALLAELENTILPLEISVEDAHTDINGLTVRTQNLEAGQEASLVKPGTGPGSIVLKLLFLNQPTDATASGPGAVAAGRGCESSGAHSTTFGFFNKAQTNAGVASGFRNETIAVVAGTPGLIAGEPAGDFGKYAGGRGRGVLTDALERGNYAPITSAGIAAFAHSTNTAAATPGNGAIAHYSAILGGVNAHVPKEATGVVLTASDNTTVPLNTKTDGTGEPVTYTHVSPQFLMAKPGGAYWLRSPNGTYVALRANDDGTLNLVAGGGTGAIDYSSPQYVSGNTAVTMLGRQYYLQGGNATVTIPPADPGNHGKLIQFIGVPGATGLFSIGAAGGESIGGKPVRCIWENESMTLQSTPNGWIRINGISRAMSVSMRKFGGSYSAFGFADFDLNLESTDSPAGAMFENGGVRILRDGVYIHRLFGSFLPDPNTTPQGAELYLRVNGDHTAGAYQAFPGVGATVLTMQRKFRAGDYIKPALYSSVPGQLETDYPHRAMTYTVVEVSE